MHSAFKHTFALLVHIHLKTNQQDIFIRFLNILIDAKMLIFDFKDVIKFV